MKRRRHFSVEMLLVTRALCILGLHTSPLLYGGGGSGGGRVCTFRSNSLASAAARASSRRVHTPPFRGRLRCPPRSLLPLQQRKASTAANNDTAGGDYGPNSNGDNQEVWAGERQSGKSAGSSREEMVGSPEFVSLVKAQFDVLTTVLGVHRVVLFVRRENPETGARVACVCVCV